MAHVVSKDDNLNNYKDNCFKKINLLEEKEQNLENATSSIVLNKMNALISTMQELQKLFIADQIPEKTVQPKNLEKELSKPSQTEILLQQVQNAMESTIAQLSNRGTDRVDPALTDQNKMEDNVLKQLTISEKWRLYTEMYQTKRESSQEYCLNKMRLGQELGLSFKETKREMLIGLWSNRLAVVLYLKQHETEDDLLKEIDDWEKIESARSEVFKKYRNKSAKNNF